MMSAAAVGFGAYVLLLVIVFVIVLLLPFQSALEIEIN